MCSPNPPDVYSMLVEVRFKETWKLNGHIRTADQLLSLSDEIVSTASHLIVYWYQFEFNSELYEFNLVGEQAKGIDPKAALTAFINPDDLSKCWMNGHELVVHLWEPSEDL